MFLVPLHQPAEVAVTRPGIAVQRQNLQPAEVLQSAGQQVLQLIVRQVQVSQTRAPERTQERQGGEAVGVEIQQPVTFQLQEFEGRQTAEGERLDGVDLVVVEVKTDKSGQTLEHPAVH